MTNIPTAKPTTPPTLASANTTRLLRDLLLAEPLLAGWDQRELVLALGALRKRLVTIRSLRRDIQV